MSVKQRQPAFDILKGFAIILVVYGHLMGNASAELVLMDDMVMPLFCFISGYFSREITDRTALGKTLLKKCRTLLVPYVFWSLVSAGANIALGMLKGNPVDIGTELVDVLVYGRSVWFLLMLFLTSSLFSVTSYLARKWKLNAAREQMFVWGGYLLLVFALPNDALCLYKVKWLYPFLLFGYWLKQHGVLTEPRKIKAWAWAAAVPGAIACAVTLLKPQWLLPFASFSFENLAQVGITAVAYVFFALQCIAAFALVSTVQSRLNVFAQLGQHTMDVYVVHMFVIKLLPLSLLSGWMMWVVLAVAAVAISLGIWLLSKYLLRKIPLYRVLLGVNG